MFDTHLMGCTLPKNVMESLLGTLMQSKDKGKDSLQCHMDLEAMGVRVEPHPLTLPNGKKKLPSCIVVARNKGEREALTVLP